MAVQVVQSATRVLVVFEAIATHQPVGLGALTRLLAEDKSALQRALRTLSGLGWIERVDGSVAWQVSPKVGRLVQGPASLRVRARPVLAALRDDIDETVIMAVPEGGRITMVEIAESQHLVRSAPRFGQIAGPTRSSLAQAFLALVPPTDVPRYLDDPADADAGFARRLALVRRRGWAIRLRCKEHDAAGVAAAIVDGRGAPVGAVCISAPTDRMPPSSYRRYASKVVVAARVLSDA